MNTRKLNLSNLYITNDKVDVQTQDESSIFLKYFIQIFFYFDIASRAVTIMA